MSRILSGALGRRTRLKGFGANRCSEFNLQVAASASTHSGFFEAVFFGTTQAKACTLYTSSSVFRDPAVFEADNSIAVSGINFRVSNLHYGGALVVQHLEHLHDFFALR